MEKVPQGKGVCRSGLSVPRWLWCFPKPCPGHGEVVLGQMLAVPTVWAGHPCTDSHPSHEKAPSARIFGVTIQ